MNAARRVLRCGRRLLAIAVVLAAIGAAALTDSRPARADHNWATVYDLAVTGMMYAYLPAHTYPFSAGWYLIVTVKNTGLWGIANPFTVKVTSPDCCGGPIDLQYYTLGGLAKGASKGIPHKMPACTATTTFDRLAFVDSGKQIYEFDEHNNIETWTHHCP